MDKQTPQFAINDRAIFRGATVQIERVRWNHDNTGALTYAVRVIAGGTPEMRSGDNATGKYFPLVPECELKAPEFNCPWCDGIAYMAESPAPLATCHELHKRGHANYQKKIMKQNTLITAGEDTRENRKPIEQNANHCQKRELETIMQRRKSAGVNGEVTESMFSDVKPVNAAGQVSLF